jgi:hypothetical protein
VLSSASALPDGLFEHPAWCTPVAQDAQPNEGLACKNSFLASCQTGRTGWLIWSVSFIWFVWFVSFVWLNKTNKMNKTNQRNQMNQIILSASGLLLAGKSLRG